MAKKTDAASSRTAEFTCFTRAASYAEKDLRLKSDDYISYQIIPRGKKILIRLPAARHFLVRRLFARGMFEYVVARTKYIDGEFRQALNDGFEQILIFGAGYDSRAIRFQSSAKDIRLFELDTSETQSSKIAWFGHNGIRFPANLTFIPIDFDTQSLADRLDACGFERGRRTLFLLEGLTMYLEPGSIDRAFRTIAEYAGTGSRLVFDYIYAPVLSHPNLYYGGEEAARAVEKVGEKWIFGIAEGKLEEFLSGYHLEAARSMNADALENEYFKSACAGRTRRINGTHCIVTAVKK
ncbi:MAG: SAM-dependent methyltransferase [Clostridia bacterium]|nr:SAM-dependent methyltransferase [Clostridia bacterium]